jgi:hypothetical protein
MAKKKAVKNYNREEFKNIFCQSCGICVKPNPILCYDKLYKKQSKRFLKSVFPNLIYLRRVLGNQGRGPGTLRPEELTNTICVARGICNGIGGRDRRTSPCDNLYSCLSMFKMQAAPFASACAHDTTGQQPGHESRSTKAARRAAKRKRAYVCEPYPTVLHRDSEKFITTIENILGGNNNRQQDTDKKLST